MYVYNAQGMGFAKQTVNISMFSTNEDLVAAAVMSLLCLYPAIEE